METWGLPFVPGIEAVVCRPGPLESEESGSGPEEDLTNPTYVDRVLRTKTTGVVS